MSYTNHHTTSEGFLHIWHQPPDVYDLGPVVEIWFDGRFITVERKGEAQPDGQDSVSSGWFDLYSRFDRGTNGHLHAVSYTVAEAISDAEGLLRMWAADAKQLRSVGEDDSPLGPYRPPTVVVIRDPDASNDFTVFGGDVEIHDMDLGYMCLNDPDEYLEWAEGHLAYAEKVDDPGVAALVRQVVAGACPSELREGSEIEWASVAQLVAARRV
jgi:hypothetical protein